MLLRLFFALNDLFFTVSVYVRGMEYIREKKNVWVYLTRYPMFVYDTINREVGIKYTERMFYYNTLSS